MRWIDPFFYILRYLILGQFFGQLKPEEEAFVITNITKHRKVLWVNFLAVYPLYRGIQQSDDIPILVLSLIAPVMVMGGAWFAISFGAIPKKLIAVSMTITFWMFTAFTVSLTSMFTAVSLISPPIIWPVLAIIYIGAAVSCIQYDTADGLKAGLDEAVLSHSRYAVSYYKTSGVKPED